MQQVFKVYNNYQAHDADDWHNWVGTNTISYHRTLEGAQNKIKELIANELEVLNITIARNADISAEYWEARKKDVQNNTVYLQSGTRQEDRDEYELFCWVPIVLED